MKWTGTLDRVDVGPGAWVLQTDDGERLTLYGEVPVALRGRRVHVEGQRAIGMGFAMTGDVAVEVSRVSAA